MVNARVLHAIATRPHLYAQWQLTGRLPSLSAPRSPLVDILGKISPRDRAAMLGFTVSPSLGYNGSRQFPTAEQALRWIRPHSQMMAHESWPAESWRMKNFQRPLYIEDLLAACSCAPEQLAVRYAQLRRPVVPGPGPDESTDPPVLARERPRP